MMIDTMTSSIKYQNYDLDRQAVVGYQLPADPYWLAPPQGSIVPIWHQGGLPNYQPKPMVCRHVQDPIKAWERELEQKRREDAETPAQGLRGVIDEHGRAPKIKIFSCSSGVNASKMARKLYSTLERMIADTHDTFELEAEKALNSLSLADVTPDDVILIIASTTGSGEVPSNAAKFVREYSSAKALEKAPRFSVFANGDSTYGDTYNAAAKQIQEVMSSMGCRPLLGHCFAGDTALKNPDWESFNQWLHNIDHLFLGNLHKVDLPTSLENVGDKTTALRAMPFATLAKKYRPHPNGMVCVTFDIGDLEYHEMDHLKILAPNPRTEVRRALKSLGLQENAPFTWHSEDAFSFLCRFVDLSRPFKTLRWYPGFGDLNEEAKNALRNLAVCDLLDRVKIPWTEKMIEEACKDMGSVQPRVYSVASCQRKSSNDLDHTKRSRAATWLTIWSKLTTWANSATSGSSKLPLERKLDLARRAQTPGDSCAPSDLMRLSSPSRPARAWAPSDLCFRAARVTSSGPAASAALHGPTTKRKRSRASKLPADLRSDPAWRCVRCPSWSTTMPILASPTRRVQSICLRVSRPKIQS